MDADGIAKRLRHLLYAVKPFDDGRHQHDLRGLAIVPLQLTAYQQVEFLIGAAQLDIALQCDRVVPLRQRVQHFVQGNRLLFFPAFVELIALQHLRNRKLRRQPDNALKTERVEPLGVKAYLSLLPVQNAKNLVGVALCIFVDLLARQRLARDGAPCRVANQRSKIADQKDNLVPKILEVLELAHQHGMAQVQVRCCRVKARLDAQRRAGTPRLLQPLAQVRDTNNLGCALLQQVELFLYRKECLGALWLLRAGRLFYLWHLWRLLHLFHEGLV